MPKKTLAFFSYQLSVASHQWPVKERKLDEPDSHCEALLTGNWRLVTILSDNSSV